MRVALIALCASLAPFAVVAQDRSSIPGSVRDSMPSQQSSSKGKLLGVFDARTGEPISGAMIIDLKSRRSASTSLTGTVALDFVDSAGALVRIAKLGYETRTQLTTGLSDTMPITIVLHPVAQTLPAAVTTVRGSRGPADTVRVLERFGFYERRETTGAPRSAFVTSEQLKELRLLKDIDKLTGRQICTTNLYVNGSLIDAPSLQSMPGSKMRSAVGPPMRDKLDALFKPEDILAIELYRTGEMPPQYNSTRQSNCGLTLVWTK